MATTIATETKTLVNYRVEDGIAVIGLDDGLSAHRRKGAADRHQDIGVINRAAGGVLRIECHELIVELLRELAQNIEIRARR